MLRLLAGSSGEGATPRKRYGEQCGPTCLKPLPWTAVWRRMVYSRATTSVRALRVLRSVLLRAISTLQAGRPGCQYRCPLSARCIAGCSESSRGFLPSRGFFSPLPELVVAFGRRDSAVSALPACLASTCTPTLTPIELDHARGSCLARPSEVLARIGGKRSRPGTNDLLSFCREGVPGAYRPRQVEIGSEERRSLTS